MKRVEVTEFTLAKDARTLKKNKEMLVELDTVYSRLKKPSLKDKIAYWFTRKLVVLVGIKGYEWIVKEDRRRLGYE